MLLMTSSLCLENALQRRVNIFRPCLLANQGTMQLHWSIIELSAPFLHKNVYGTIVTMSNHARQRRVNDYWSCMVVNLMAMECTLPTRNLLAAFIGKNASDNIASTSYNWVPSECQQLCGCPERYTVMHCIVLVLYWVLCSQSFQSVLVYNVTNMHAMA
jgi:hypothetical protein